MSELTETNTNKETETNDIGNTNEETETTDINKDTLLATGKDIPTADIKEGEGNYITGETQQLNTDPESEQLLINEGKQKQLIQLIDDTGLKLVKIATSLKYNSISIDEASKQLLATAAKLQDENPLKGGKSRRKAYKNKKKNKTKKGGRKSKKNQKNKR
jgi:hypothetical protein